MRLGRWLGEGSIRRPMFLWAEGLSGALRLGLVARVPAPGVLGVGWPRRAGGCGRGSAGVVGALDYVKKIVPTLVRGGLSCPG